jgi:hypothetical protein
MKISVSTLGKVVLASSLLAALAGLGMAADDSGKEMSYDVVFIQGPGKNHDGRLTFLEELIIYQPSDRAAEEMSWSYGDLQSVDASLPRLFKFKVAKGQTVQFAPFGGQAFDPGLGEFVRGKVSPNVKVKTGS